WGGLTAPSLAASSPRRSLCTCSCPPPPSDGGSGDGGDGGKKKSELDRWFEKNLGPEYRREFIAKLGADEPRLTYQDPYPSRLAWTAEKRAAALSPEALKVSLLPYRGAAAEEPVLLPCL